MVFVFVAIEQLKEESLKWKAKQAGPVWEELFPLKSHSIANGWAEKPFEHPNEEKMSWLNSVCISSKPSHKDQIQADLVLHPGEPVSFHFLPTFKYMLDSRMIIYTTEARALNLEVNN